MKTPLRNEITQNYTQIKQCTVRKWASINIEIETQLNGKKIVRVDTTL